MINKQYFNEMINKKIEVLILDVLKNNVLNVIKLILQRLNVKIFTILDKLLITYYFNTYEKKQGVLCFRFFLSIFTLFEGR